MHDGVRGDRLKTGKDREDVRVQGGSGSDEAERGGRPWSLVRVGDARSALPGDQRARQQVVIVVAVLTEEVHMAGTDLCDLSAVGLRVRTASV